jgi:tetratricopeptide (TPR) repeat protein
MKEEQRVEIINYLEKASVAIFCLLFLIFPIAFTSLTTDFFILPKQALVIFASLAVVIMFGVKTLLLGKVRIRRTPFDLPILLLLLALLLSAIFSAVKIDSFTNVLPVIMAGIAYFGIVYNTKNEKSVLALITSLLAGAILLSLISLFTFFKVYIFPFDFAKNVAFTPAGSILDQALYLLFVLPIGLYFLAPFILKRKLGETSEEKRIDIIKIVGFGGASLLILVGLSVSIYNLLKVPGNFVILPLETGFQTAFAAISQDSGRILQGLLFGSGFGEYLMDFTRFKQATFNLNPTLWTFAFTHSSTFVLELLATTGILGFFSYLFLCYKIVREKPLFVPILIVLAASFVLPLSFYTLVVIFFLLAVYASLRGLIDNQKYFDVELELVALKKGFLAFAPESQREKGYGKMLSYTVFAVIVVLTLSIGYLSYDYLATNIVFEKSLVAASKNDGQLTYNDQTATLATFTGKYNDVYYRVFSQTNLSLANSLAASVPKGASPSAQTQQTIYTLVQQSINTARQATTMSPLNTIDWQNLATIYRNLIGFGQNADQFAILAEQQAVQLDPTNPQAYIALGGIYYQLGQWDKAQEQFQQSANLKPDFANAYYNIAHTLIQKNDLKDALTALQTVRSLVLKDQANLSKVDQEIKAIEAQIGQTAQTEPAGNQPSANPLSVTAPETLPSQNPPVKIPAPKAVIAPTAKPTAEPTVSPTTEGGLPIPSGTVTPTP